VVLLSIPFIGAPDRTAGTPALNVTVQGSIDNGNLGSTFLMNEKQEAREKAIQIRRKLPFKDQEISSHRIKEIWDSVKGSFNFKNVGFYWPAKGELSSLPIIEELLKEGSRCFLPIVSTNPKERRLIFKEYTANTQLEANRFNISEPKNGEEIATKKLDLVFLPCACIDEVGHRIGMGMGFYDKTFEESSSSQQLIALAYDFQKIYSCFPEKQDVPVDGVITPSGFCSFYSKKAI
jgi:5-formyltetrahydrofolate cyclo-ligase